MLIEIEIIDKDEYSFPSGVLQIKQLLFCEGLMLASSRDVHKIRIVLVREREMASVVRETSPSSFSGLSDLDVCSSR